MSTLIEETERPAGAPDEVPRRSRLTDRVGDHVCVAIGVMWVVGYLAVGALEPFSREALPTVAIVLAVAFYVGLTATVVGLGARRRWGIVASLATAVLFLASVVACPATGHHQLGTWWIGQILVTGALVVGSAIALGLSGARRQARPLTRSG